MEFFRLQLLVYLLGNSETSQKPELSLPYIQLTTGYKVRETPNEKRSRILEGSLISLVLRI